MTNQTYLKFATLPMIFCSGFGQHHTDNPNAKTKRKPYQPISWANILEMLKTPQEVSKENGNPQWVIFSDQLGEHGRNADYLRNNAKFSAIWADIDERGYPKSKIEAFVDSLNCIGVIHTTASANATEGAKWRMILPLAEQVGGEQFELMQRVLNDRLQAAGIEPDRKTEISNQICYLPNRGEVYDYSIVHCDFLDNQFEPLHPSLFAGEIEAIKQAENEHKAQQQAQREANRAKQAQRVASDELSPIAAYNAAFSVQSELEIRGYIKRGNRYLSPNSESGAAGVTVKNDRWYSSHGSDVGLGIGRISDKGVCSGDAFDLFKFYEHGNDHKAALKAAGAMFTTAQGVTITKQNQINHMEAKGIEWANNTFEVTEPQTLPQWAQAMRNGEKTQPTAQPNQQSTANAETAGDLESYLPEFSPHLLHLPAMLGEMQDYIYNRMIYPCRAMAGVSALAFMSHFAQNKAYLETPMGKLSLNEYWLVMAKTGFGKESLIKSLYNLDNDLSERFLNVETAQIQQATPASQQGLHKLLEDKTAQTFMSDEFAEWLVQSSKGNDSHKQGALGYLMQIYTKGFGYVNVPNAVTAKYQPVKDPRVTIFATTTGERLTEALTGSQADSGSYNRFVMFVGNPDRIEKRYSGFKWNANPSLLNQLERILMLNDQAMTMRADAVKYFIKYDSEVIEPLKFDDPRLAGRLSEQALKLAALIALGSSRYEVIEDDLIQAFEIRLNLYHRAKAFIDHEGGLSGDDHTVKAYEQIADLLTRKRQMSVSTIKNHSRQYKKLKLYEQEQVLRTLQNNGIAVMVKNRGGNVLVHSDHYTPPQ